jgi:hypothetical protein
LWTDVKDFDSRLKKIGVNDARSRHKMLEKMGQFFCPIPRDFSARRSNRSRAKRVSTACRQPEAFHTKMWIRC